MTPPAKLVLSTGNVSEVFPGILSTRLPGPLSGPLSVLTPPVTVRVLGELTLRLFEEFSEFCLKATTLPPNASEPVPSALVSIVAVALKKAMLLLVPGLTKPVSVTKLVVDNTVGDRELGIVQRQRIRAGRSAEVRVDDLNPAGAVDAERLGRRRQCSHFAG